MPITLKFGQNSKTIIIPYNVQHPIPSHKLLAITHLVFFIYDYRQYLSVEYLPTLLGLEDRIWWSKSTRMAPPTLGAFDKPFRNFLEYHRQSFVSFQNTVEIIKSPENTLDRIFHKHTQSEFIVLEAHRVWCLPQRKLNFLERTAANAFGYILKPPHSFVPDNNYPEFLTRAEYEEERRREFAESARYWGYNWQEAYSYGFGHGGSNFNTESRETTAGLSAEGLTAELMCMMSVTGELSRHDFDRAYRQAAFRYHPDKNSGRDDQFKRLGQLKDIYFVYRGWI